MDDYYRHANANIHRATHLLSERATALYEGARAKAAAFINAPDPQEHRPDQGHDRRHQPRRPELRPLDAAGRATRSSISWLEHHSNIVPWQLRLRADRRGLRVVPIDDAARSISTHARGAVAADADRGDQPCVERARNRQPDRADDRAGARARRRRAGRRRAGGAALAGRRAGARLRLLRVLEPQDVRADRRRRALRHGGRCSRRCRRIRAAAT